MHHKEGVHGAPQIVKQVLVGEPSIRSGEVRPIHDPQRSCSFIPVVSVEDEGALEKTEHRDDTQHDNDGSFPQNRINSGDDTDCGPLSPKREAADELDYTSRCTNDDITRVMDEGPPKNIKTIRYVMDPGSVVPTHRATTLDESDEDMGSRPLSSFSSSYDEIESLRRCRKQENPGDSLSAEKISDYDENGQSIKQPLSASDASSSKSFHTEYASRKELIHRMEWLQGQLDHAKHVLAKEKTNRKRKQKSLIKLADEMMRRQRERSELQASIKEV